MYFLFGSIAFTLGAIGESFYHQFVCSRFCSWMACRASACVDYNRIYFALSRRNMSFGNLSRVQCSSR